MQVHTKKRNKLSPKKLHNLDYVKFNAWLKNKIFIPNRDTLVTYNEKKKITEWLVPDKRNGKAIDDEDFQGEQLLVKL